MDKILLKNFCKVSCKKMLNVFQNKSQDNIFKKKLNILIRIVLIKNKKNINLRMKFRKINYSHNNNQMHQTKNILKQDVNFNQELLNTKISTSMKIYNNLLINVE